MRFPLSTWLDVAPWDVTCRWLRLESRFMQSALHMWISWSHTWFLWQWCQGRSVLLWKCKSVCLSKKNRAKQHNSLSSSIHVQVQKAFHFANASQEFQHKAKLIWSIQKAKPQRIWKTTRLCFSQNHTATNWNRVLEVVKYQERSTRLLPSLNIFPEGSLGFLTRWGHWAESKAPTCRLLLSHT